VYSGRERNDLGNCNSAVFTAGATCNEDSDAGV
jgi:hypothetical protein